MSGNWSLQIECRECDSPFCDGCNIFRLANAMKNGKFAFNDRHGVIIPDKQRYGRWVLVDEMDDMCGAHLRYLECSVCGKESLFNHRGHSCQSKYCPHCGAKMGVE